LAARDPGDTASWSTGAVTGSGSNGASPATSASSNGSTDVKQTTIVSEADYARWRLEYQLADDLIRKIEASERALLETMRCPTDPVQIEEILSGSRPAPWPKRTAARDRQRALHAMHVLVRLYQVRHHIALGEENARLGVHEALLAGLYASSASIEAELGRTVRYKNAAAAKRPRSDGSDERSTDRVRVLRAARRYRASKPDTTLFSQRAMASTVAGQLTMNTHTVRYILRTNKIR
jgi:hypothetical protein